MDEVSSFEDDPSAILLAIAVFLPADDTAVSSLVELTVILVVAFQLLVVDPTVKKTVLPYYVIFFCTHASGGTYSEMNIVALSSL